MKNLIKFPVRAVGISPGYISPVQEEPLSDKISISIIEYGENHFSEKNNVSIKQCLEKLKNPSMTWIIVNGITDAATIAYIGKQFKIHPLALEDIMNTNQRAKLDTYQDQVFIISRFLFHDQVSHNLSDEQVSIIFGPNYLICFLENEQDIFLPIKQRLRKTSSRFRSQGSDYLAYAILDVIVDYYLVVLEKTDFELDYLEEEVVNTPTTTTLQKIRKAKRQMITLRKTIWPMRDVINRFQQLDNVLITPYTQVYLHDVYDHTIQTIDMIEGFRDVVSGMLEVYLSNINIRMNEIMKLLTIVSTIFVPLTFITGIYGMNFDYMPELHYRWSYFVVLTTMAAIAISMLYYFYRRRWI